MGLAPTVIKLSNLDGKNGFVIDGIQKGSRSGAVASAGDVNKDGFADIIVGAYQAGTALQASGDAYVLFGKASGIPKEFGLSSITGAAGFKISGLSSFDAVGYTVSPAGDVNGDGYADVFVGSFESAKANNPDAAFVVLGKANGLVDINLLEIDGANGFQLNASLANDQHGYSVSAAGDVNGDGIADLIVGAEGINGGAGQSYVVFGTTKGFDRVVDLVTLDGTKGYRIDGVKGEASGASVAGIGDINGDGIADLLIGAPGDQTDIDPLTHKGISGTGHAYIVFGSKAPAGSVIDLASLSTRGLAISGTDLDDLSGASVASAGDVNGDGIADLIIGAPRTGTSSAMSQGAAYVVYGKVGGLSDPINLAALDGSNGFSITGPGAYSGAGTSVAGHGDFNGDGVQDVLIGAPGMDVGSNANAGAAFLIFGKKGGLGSKIDLAALSASDGIQFDGATTGAFAGSSVSFAGDINKDGFDDIIIGAYGASPNNIQGAGQSFVIYGHATASTPAPVPTPTPTPIPTPTPDPSPGPRPGPKVVGTDDSETLTGSGSKDSMIALGGDDKIFSYAGDDKIRLGEGNDFADAGLGRDTVWGGAGNDTLVGGLGADSIIGGRGSDTASYVESFNGVKTSLDGSLKQTGHARGDTYVSIENLEGSKVGGDVLAGNELGNVLTGNGGNDKLIGLAGADTLIGGDGADTLIGGKGADVFKFVATTDGGDVIKDFGAADRIALSAEAFGDGAAGAVAATSFVSSAAGTAVDSDDHFLYRTSDHTLWFDADGSGTGSAVLLATLINGFALTAGHLILE